MRASTLHVSSFVGEQILQRAMCSDGRRNRYRLPLCSCEVPGQGALADIRTEARADKLKEQE